MPKPISAAELRARLPQAAVYDARAFIPPEGAIPGARQLTLEQVQAGLLPQAPRDRPVYLICERGAVSELIGLYLEAEGFSEVYTVTGGLAAWRALPKG